MFSLSRSHAFWLLQTGGWSAYVLVKGIAFPLATTDAIWVVSKGIALTSLLRLAVRRLDRWRLPAAAYVAIALTMALVTTLLSLGASVWATSAGWVFHAPGTAEWLSSVEGLLFESLLFMAWTAVYLGIRHGLDLQAERRNLSIALARAEHARALMLRYQLNPHFLFNALASLRALVGEDAQRAERVITDLSAFLRYSMIDCADEQSTVERELEAVRRYLAIQKVRFEERIEYHVDCEPGLADVRVPTFLIQPLVENAVKYGMHSTRAGPVSVEVSARMCGQRCQLEVRNNGKWIPEGAPDRTQLDRSGLGLRNVRARLAAQMQRNYSFTVGPSGNHVVALVDFDLA